LIVKPERANLTVLVIAAVGVSGSGKTTTLEYLISHLSKEKYKIGSVKHIHIPNFTIDKEGTNTWRYAKAGSKVTVAISPHEIAIIKKTEASPNQIDEVIELLEKEQLDIVFIEGFHRTISKKQNIPKIITAKDATDLQVTLKNAVPPVLAITGVFAQNSTKKVEDKIPLIKIPAEGEQLLKIIRELLKNPPSV
jgi:molybdopterin-guanine dinucleotide biosynthesis protein B